MDARNLLISVRLYDGRYYGTGESCPSSGRLFQALVAGAASGARLPADRASALGWLETLNPPLLGQPYLVAGQPYRLFVPNNDLDAIDGDSRRIGEIRASKSIQPRFFDCRIPFLFAWEFAPGRTADSCAKAICNIAEHLYQFGRGSDMAWATGEILEAGQLEARLASYPGVISHPTGHSRRRLVSCPQQGSFASLTARHEAGTRRFAVTGTGANTRRTFSQPPKPRFQQRAYDSPPSRGVYDLRRTAVQARFAAWPLRRSSELVVRLRDSAASRLRTALPHLGEQIERTLVGRKANGDDPGPTSARVRIVPLPSVGHPNVDRAIRRVLVEVPATSSIRAEDVSWAFSGLEVVDVHTGETADTVLTPGADANMLEHFGAEDPIGFRVWRTVTPAVLPEAAARRRIDPARMRAESKNGIERAHENDTASGAVAHALRHAEVKAAASAIRVQREPFEARGERAEVFAEGTRFSKHRFWHVEIEFDDFVSGPLAIGDGRFLGLGVMAPVREVEGIHAFTIDDGLAPNPQASDLARALRRAVMSRVESVIGERTSLASFFSGHREDDSAARSEAFPHLTFTFDPVLRRLLVMAPHVADRRRPARAEERMLRQLDQALADFRQLRAGAAGALVIRRVPVDRDSDPLFRFSRTWTSLTPYQVTRHAKDLTATSALEEDLRTESNRRGLPQAEIAVDETQGVSGVGLIGRARLRFRVAVRGPVVLGRSRYLGGGLFGATDE